MIKAVDRSPDPLMVKMLSLLTPEENEQAILTDLDTLCYHMDNQDRDHAAFVRALNKLPIGTRLRKYRCTMAHEFASDEVQAIQDDYNGNFTLFIIDPNGEWDVWLEVNA